MPAVDYRSIHRFWGPVRWPRWLEVLFITLFSLLTVIAFAGCLGAAYSIGRIYSQEPLAARIVLSRLTLNLLLLFVLSLITLAAHLELFLARDLQFLFSLPLSDHEVFKLKLRRLVHGIAPAWGALSVAAIAAALGAHAGILGMIMSPLSIAAVLLVAAVISVLAAFVRVLRVIIYSIDAALLALLLFAIALGRENQPTINDLVQTSTRQSALLPASWIADLVRVVLGEPAPHGLTQAVIAVLVVLAAMCLAIFILSRRTYTQAEVLGWQEVTCTSKVDDSPRSARSIRWEGWPIASWLIARTSQKAHALFRFISRSEKPLLADRYALTFVRNNFIALLAGRLARRIADGFSQPEAGVAITIACFVAAWLLAWIEIDLLSTGLGSALRAQNKGQRAGLALPTVALPMERGDHRHPLIETWPIGIAEFTGTYFKYLMGRYFVAYILGAPFYCLGFMPDARFIAILAVIPALPFFLFFISAYHGFTYQRHPRRSHLRDILVAIALVCAGFCLIVSAVVGSILTHHPSWIAIGFVVSFAVTFLAGPFIAYALLIKTDRRRWFDAEYRMRQRGMGY